MQEDEARQILEARVRAGAKLVPAHKADVPSIKRLQQRCHEADIPTAVAPCPGGG